MTRPTTETTLGMLIGAVAAVASTLVAADALTVPDAAGHAADFQQLVGGLGLGPAVDLSRCANSFDPRLCPACPGDHGPIPGGITWCPQHACSIFNLETGFLNRRGGR